MEDFRPSSAHGSAEFITLIVTMVVSPDHEQEFLDLSSQTAKKVHDQEPGTVLYVLSQHPTKAHTYVWVERYRDADALSTHSAAPYMVDALRQLPQLLAGPPELLQLNQVVPE